MGGCMSQTSTVNSIAGSPPADQQVTANKSTATTKSAFRQASRRRALEVLKCHALRTQDSSASVDICSATASEAESHDTFNDISAPSSPGHSSPCFTPRTSLVLRVSSNTQSSIWTFYRRIRTIASGGYGRVLEVESILSQERYAVKVMDKSNLNVKSSSFDFENEVQCLQNLAGSPFIVRIHGAYESERHLYLIMELSPGGDLLQFLRDDGPQPADVAREIARQLALGVSHMHNHGVVHRDLKPENVLVSQSAGKLRVKICDFGLSKLLSSVAPSKIGTILYAAPEVLLGTREAGPEADMWAVGLILFMIIGGYHPFDEFAEYDERRIMSRMVKGDFNFKDTAWLSVSTAAKDAIQHCLDTSPFTRWTAKDLFESAWLAGRAPAHPRTPALPTRSPSENIFEDECSDSENLDSVLADLMCLDACQSSRLKVPALPPIEDVGEPSSLETSPLSPEQAVGSGAHRLVGTAAPPQPHEDTKLPGTLTSCSGSPGSTTSPSSSPSSASSSAVSSTLHRRHPSAVILAHRTADIHTAARDAWCSMTPPPVTRTVKGAMLSTCDSQYTRRKVLHVNATPSPPLDPIDTPGNSPIVRAVRVPKEMAILRAAMRKRRRSSRSSSSKRPSSSLASSVTADNVELVNKDEVKLARVLSGLPKHPTAPPSDRPACAAAAHRQHFTAAKCRPSTLLASMREIDNEACQNVTTAAPAAPTTPIQSTAPGGKPSSLPAQTLSSDSPASSACNSPIGSPFLSLVVEDVCGANDLHIRGPHRRQAQRTRASHSSQSRGPSPSSRRPASASRSSHGDVMPQPVPRKPMSRQLERVRRQLQLDARIRRGT